MFDTLEPTGEICDPKALITTALMSMVGCITLHSMLRPIVRLFPTIAQKYRGDWINRCVALLHAHYAGTRCFRAILNESPFDKMVSNIIALHPGPANYATGISQTLLEVLPVTMGYMLYDMVVMSIDPKVYMPLMVVHHVGSLVVWPYAVCTGCSHLYVLYMLATELTSLILHPTVFFIPQHGLGASAIQIFFGILLICAFFVFRILPVPFQIYSYWVSRHAFLELSRLQFILAFTMAIPMAMNMYWFWLMLRRALRVFTEPKPKEKI